MRREVEARQRNVFHVRQSAYWLLAHGIYHLDGTKLIEVWGVYMGSLAPSFVCQLLHC